MDDKEILIDILIEKISNIPSVMFGIDLGPLSKKYGKVLILNQIETKYSFINMFFNNGLLIEHEMFFESINEIINNSQIKILGIVLDNSFINSIHQDYKIKKGL